MPAPKKSKAPAEKPAAKAAAKPAAKPAPKAAAKSGASKDNPLKPKDHVFLVDGSGYIFRAYHALPPLTASRTGSRSTPFSASATCCGSSSRT